MLNAEYVNAIYLYDEIIQDEETGELERLIAILHQAYCHYRMTEQGSRNTTNLALLQPSNYAEYLSFEQQIKDQILNFQTNQENNQDISEIPQNINLLSNYPNPFNPTTTISFEITTESVVRLDIYNIRGQHVTKLTDDFYQAGRHNIEWNGHDNNGRNVSSGIYFYQIRVGDLTQTKRMVMLK